MPEVLEVAKGFRFNLNDETHCSSGYVMHSKEDASLLYAWHSSMSLDMKRPLSGRVLWCCMADWDLNSHGLIAVTHIELIRGP